MAAIGAQVYIGNNDYFYFPFLFPHSGRFTSGKVTDSVLTNDHTKVTAMLPLLGLVNKVFDNQFLN